jgi:hypothetical protein
MTEAESPPPKVFAKVEVTRQLESGSITPATGRVCFERRNGQKWKWSVSLESFEPIHGVSRVTKLVEEQLGLAANLSLRNLPDPGADGTLLVDQLLDLLKIFRDQLDSRGDLEGGRPPAPGRQGAEGPELTLEFSFGGYAPGREEGGLGLEATLDTLAESLERFKRFLVGRAGREQLCLAAQDIRELSVDLLVCCEFYLSFVRLVLIAAQRSWVTPKRPETLRAEARLAAE